MLAVVTNVYIDGMNLFYGCLKGTPFKWLDLVALSKILMPQHQIQTVRYFTARVISRPHDPYSHLRQDVYLQALATLPEIAIHLGHFRQDRVRMPVASPPPNTIEVIKTEEKGSDVNLASYLLLDAFENRCDCQLVITNDSDLSEPVRIVRQQLGRRIGIANPHRAFKRSLMLQGDIFKQIRPGGLKRSQLPEKIVGQNGAVWRRPAEWS
jgi:hypothetical protein